MQGYKPYWSVLHRGYLSFYYDATMKDRKDSFYLVDLKDVIKVGSTRIQFVR